MDEPKHTFPLPPLETSKLEEVRQTLRHQPPYDQLKDFVRANPWPCVLVALVLGFFAAKLAR